MRGREKVISSQEVTDIRYQGENEKMKRVWKLKFCDEYVSHSDFKMRINEM